ncbi:hypothetical protein D3C75_1093740 [compost metagenome]
MTVVQVVIVLGCLFIFLYQHPVTTYKACLLCEHAVDNLFFCQHLAIQIVIDLGLRVTIGLHVPHTVGVILEVCCTAALCHGS